MWARPLSLVLAAAAASLGVAACGASTEPARPAAAASAGSAASTDDGLPAGVPFRALPEERHFAALRQLTFGGENAEAYWAFGGRSLILQARGPREACDRIYRMPLEGARPALMPVSSGKGATTCSYFFPGDTEVLFASTHLGGDACPPKPDRSQGYVWPLYESYDVFRAKADGSGLVRLTDTPGYDAEATVCKKDGSIVFTSTRDGDLDLYRMDADGKNVRRLTDTPGYDGGAFFNDDCSKIVWRASRPKEGKELDEFRALLARRLVRPSKLEIYVANADGSEAQQVTYLDAASFAPFWHPSQKRILFSSNYGDPKGREFDIWAIDASGADLERVTFAGGFDGFPMFSPDGRYLAFSSNRATGAGQSDTNVFLARWDDGPPRSAAPPAPRTDGPAADADRVRADVAYLADDAREGRGVGTRGLAEAGAYVEARFAALGLHPERQVFPVTTELRREAGTALAIAGKALPEEAFAPLPFSANGTVEGKVAFVGYGVVDRELGVDDYARKDVKGRIVLVRRFAPEGATFATPAAQQRAGDLRRKAWAAKERGAVGLLVVDLPAATGAPPAAHAAVPEEARFPPLVLDGYGDAELPVAIVRRAEGAALVAALGRGAPVAARLSVALRREATPAFNVIAKLPAAGKPRRSGALVVGAHYDHLGLGGRHSLTPDVHEPHNGADDNASGTAALLEVARTLTGANDLTRDVYFVAFSGEESGVLGSTHFTRNLPAGLAATDLVAMLNMDMVGRMRKNALQVLGADSAVEWPSLVQPACERARVACAAGGGGYGPSDQTPFYARGVPVLHFFTGSHGDYHKASDDTDKVNAAGAARVARIVADVARAVAARDGRLTLQASSAPAVAGDARSFGAALGTIPDYAGPPDGKGVLLAGVRPGSAAEKAGLRRGDVMIRIGSHAVSSVEDFMYVLGSAKPGETVDVVIRRDGKEVTVPATFEASKRH